MEENKNLSSFAIWRMPEQQSCRAIFSRPEVLTNVVNLDQRSGFVIAPFDAMGGHPTLFFHGDAQPLIFPSPDDAPTCGVAGLWRADNGDFERNFLAAREMLVGGKLQKVVIASHEDLDRDIRPCAMPLFRRACDAYPDAFVALVALPNGDVWLMATPELLVSSHGMNVQTMALAGTLRADEKAWDEKNKREHAVVARFVEERLATKTDCLKIEGPETVKAGALSHLRTRFRARMLKGVSAWDVATALHPTPAMCGMPQDEARDAILSIESADREYFSGLAGVISHDGDADIYVTIRCVKMSPDGARLYSGVGLMPDSDVTAEAAEAAAKRLTIKRLIF